MDKLNIYYTSHKNLIDNNFENKTIDFLNKRISHFFSNHHINILPDQKIENANEDIIISLSLINPVIDEEHLNGMIQSAISKKRIIKSKGAIPGTFPIFVSTVKNIKKESKISFEHSNMQSEYNSQFNLARMKRVIIFDKIINTVEDFYKWPFKKILDFFATKEGVELILSYKSDKKMIYFDSCPNCNHDKYNACNLDDGNPATGFLTKLSEYYFKCEKCAIVFLNPTLPNDELHVYYDQFSYEKLSEIQSLDKHYNNLCRETVSTYYNFLSVSPEVDKLKENSHVLDIGGGIGEYCIFLRKNYPSFEISLLDFRIDNKVKRNMNILDDVYCICCFEFQLD